MNQLNQLNESKLSLNQLNESLNQLNESQSFFSDSEYDQNEGLRKKDSLKKQLEYSESYLDGCLIALTSSGFIEILKNDLGYYTQTIKTVKHRKNITSQTHYKIMTNYPQQLLSEKAQMINEKLTNAMDKHDHTINSLEQKTHYMQSVIKQYEQAVESRKSDNQHQSQNTNLKQKIERNQKLAAPLDDLLNNLPNTLNINLTIIVEKQSILIKELCSKLKKETDQFNICESLINQIKNLQDEAVNLNCCVQVLKPLVEIHRLIATALQLKIMMNIEKKDSVFVQSNQIISNHTQALKKEYHKKQEAQKSIISKQAKYNKIISKIKKKLDNLLAELELLKIHKNTLELSAQDIKDNIINLKNQLSQNKTELEQNLRKIKVAISDLERKCLIEHNNGNFQTVIALNNKRQNLETQAEDIEQKISQSKKSPQTRQPDQLKSEIATLENAYNNIQQQLISIKQEQIQLETSIQQQNNMLETENSNLRDLNSQLESNKLQQKFIESTCKSFRYMSDAMYTDKSKIDKYPRLINTDPECIEELLFNLQKKLSLLSKEINNNWRLYISQP